MQAAFVRLGMPEIQVTGARTGPTLCTVRMLLPPGVRASQIRTLADDLAAEMGVTSVSVRAAEGAGGVMLIQVPVRKRQTVRIRSVLDSPEYRSAKGLPIAVGVEAAGEPVVFDLRDAPHLLIAGTTGAGKSIFMHAVLTGLIMRFPPDHLRLILIDPKGGVELGVYAGLPHLASPVITNPAAAPQYLDWAVREMDRRYRLLARHGARNIVSFNQDAAAKEKVRCRTSWWPSTKLRISCSWQRTWWKPASSAWRSWPGPPGSIWWWRRNARRKRS